MIRTIKREIEDSVQVCDKCGQQAEPGGCWGDGQYTQVVLIDHNKDRRYAWELCPSCFLSLEKAMDTKPRQEQMGGLIP